MSSSPIYYTTGTIEVFSSAPTCLARVLRVNTYHEMSSSTSCDEMNKVASGGIYIFYCDFPALSSMIRQICCSSFLSNEKGGMQALYFISKLIVATTLGVFVVGFCTVIFPFFQATRSLDCQRSWRARYCCIYNYNGFLCFLEIMTIWSGLLHCDFHLPSLQS